MLHSSNHLWACPFEETFQMTCSIEFLKLDLNQAKIISAPLAYRLICYVSSSHTGVICIEPIDHCSLNPKHPWSGIANDQQAWTALPAILVQSTFRIQIFGIPISYLVTLWWLPRIQVWKNRRRFTNKQICLVRGRTHVRIKGQDLNFYLETHATLERINAPPITFTSYG